MTIVASFDPYGLLYFYRRPEKQSHSAGQWPGVVNVALGEESDGALPGVPSSPLS